MSIRALNLVFSGGPVEPAQTLLMLAIADNADDKGRAFPGIALLAQKSRQSERNVIRVLKALELGGWLMVSRRAFGVKMQGNVYQLNMAKLEASAAPKISAKSAPKTGNPLRSDELSPDEAGRAVNTPVMDAPCDTVSCVEMSGGKDDFAAGPGDTAGSDEVTPRARRGDKSALPLLKNRHEPSLEPETTPQPPLHGGALSAESCALCESSGEASRTARSAAVAKVMRECGLSNARLAKAIGAQMDLQRGKTDDPADWNWLAERMVESRLEFVAQAHLMRRSVKAREFFEELWHSPTLWPIDPVQVRDLRQNANARIGMG